MKGTRGGLIKENWGGGPCSRVRTRKEKRLDGLPDGEREVETVVRLKQVELGSAQVDEQSGCFGEAYSRVLCVGGETEPVGKKG